MDIILICFNISLSYDQHVSLALLLMLQSSILLNQLLVLLLDPAVAQGRNGTMVGGVGAAVADSSAVAHRVVDAVLGPRVIQQLHSV
ncbi:hypothetical protein Q3G72_026920 [Acer saccharum]|nr:hypothetical protein Q3G72_026920 [Acer saccharum]